VGGTVGFHPDRNRAKPVVMSVASTSPAARAWPVRAYLALLLAALILPSLALAGALLGRLAHSERARLSAQALATAERTADALDRDLSGMIAALHTLGSFPPLEAGDLAAFDSQARTVARVLERNVILMDSSGQQVVNTRLPFGAPLPRASGQHPFHDAIRSGGPVVSNLFMGTSGNPVLLVDLSIPRGDSAAYVLGMTVYPDQLQELLRQQAPPGWVITVMDANDAVIAGTAEQERFLGHLANPDLRSHTTGGGGTWSGTLLDGTEVLAAYDRLRLADWRVAVGVPVAMVEEPLRIVLLSLGGAGLAVVLLSALLAWTIGRRIADPLGRLTLQAAQIGEGAAPDRDFALGELGLREADRVALALARSGSALRERGEALAAERARLATLVEAVPVGLVFAEAPSGRVVFGNGQVERILGHPTLMSASVEDYGEWIGYHPDGRPVEGAEYPLARALAGEARPSLKLRYRRGDGTLIWIHTVGAPIRDAAGQVTGAVCAFLDVDESERAREERARFAQRLELEVHERTSELEVALARLRAEAESRASVEEQLRQSQKMEAVGRLTGGIAHDFNNLLTVVIGSLDLLRRRLGDPRQLRYVDNALDGASRAATLTQRLLAFSRQQPLAPRPLDANRLVKSMGELLHRTLGEQVEVETALAGGLWQANVDPNQLESALLNLAVNARDAMEAAKGPRRLTIETANVYLDNAYAAAQPELTPGQYVMIAVTDTGSGMAPDIAERAFEPFFTTKPIGKGTGLGLSQVHGFVKQSGGHVAIHSDPWSGPGHGTTIKLYLPRYRTELEEAVHVSAHPPSPGDQPGGLVLFVEDQEGVRRFGAEALRDLGYGVLEAADAPTALRLLDANSDVALLLTDVVLPGMDGHRLAGEARRRRPALRVLFTTGYATNAIVPNGQAAAGMDFVVKPFTIAALAAKLREVFARPAPAAADGAEATVPG
jgi:PAS domain S-box-containing protein